MKCSAYLVLGIFMSVYLAVSGEKIIPKDHQFHFDPDITRNVTELISCKGYAVEDHVAQTEDGFLLSLQHIPSRKKRQWWEEEKEVVFLQHGLMSAASDFVLNFPDQSLGFILADAGYDVWLGNTRGNIYSRRHIKLTPDMNQFWNFSFDEMAQYDLPAMIDYVLNVTEKKQLAYIGHSQGTTAAFALLSTSPEYNKKIKVFIAMAPVATVGYVTSPARYIASFTTEFDDLFNLLGVKIAPDNVFLEYISEFVCSTELKYLCENFIYIMSGTDIAELNETRIGVYVAHSVSGSSTKSLVHYAQMVFSKKFCKFDYGKEGNMKEYHQITPPEYNVSRITTPVALIWSLNDQLADPADVGLLVPKLKSLDSSYCVKYPTFSHADFVMFADANKLVYPQILSLLHKYKKIPSMQPPPWFQFEKDRFNLDSPFFNYARYEFV